MIFCFFSKFLLILFPLNQWRTTMLLLQHCTDLILKIVNEFCKFMEKYATITATTSSNLAIDLFFFEEHGLLNMKPCFMNTFGLITQFATVLDPSMLESLNQWRCFSRNFSFTLVIVFSIPMKRGKYCSQAIHFNRWLLLLLEDINPNTLKIEISFCKIFLFAIF